MLGLATATIDYITGVGNIATRVARPGGLHCSFILAKNDNEVIKLGDGLQLACLVSPIHQINIIRRFDKILLSSSGENKQTKKFE
jgi:hypothetical protein